MTRNKKNNKKEDQKKEKSINKKKSSNTGGSKSKKKPAVKATVKKKASSDTPKAINDSNISLEGLLRAGCHFGHSVSKVNPRMQDYIFTAREGIHIFDLVKTKNQLEKAIEYLFLLVSEGGKIIFLGTKRQAIEATELAAKKTGMFYVTTRWVGGLLTNWKEVRKNLDRLDQLNKKLAKKNTSLTKYEISVLKREQRRLENLYGGLMGLENLPQALFVVDPKKEKTAVREAKRMGVTVVAIADSNADPRGIDYLIPANDDAKASVEYILAKVAQKIDSHG
ncbi:MAG: 30S ribosomal protein S2 [Microgenomates bacterium 39_6]|nr:MAG: 30S ribosomal protein S2 [Microgenomates bacterium 39_6]